MKSSLNILALLVAVLGLAASAFAAEKAAADRSAKPTYPLTTCVVSGDKLDGNSDMGPPIDHIYKVEGKPDRLVRLCCKSCIKKFDKDPAKYLKMIDDAAAGKTPAKEGQTDHKH